MKENKKHKKQTNLGNYLTVGLIVAVIIFTVFNLLQASQFSSAINEKVIESAEASRPAEVQVTLLLAPSCPDCYDSTQVVDIIESTGVNITEQKELDMGSEEAQQLISDHSIDKLPTVIVTGELDRSSKLSRKLSDLGERQEDTFIFTQLEPPYVNAQGKTQGKISLIHLTKAECQGCTDLSSMIAQFTDSGLIFAYQKEVDVASEEGKALIDKYKIISIPALILDSQAAEYQNIADGWNQFGTKEVDGSFVMRHISPPYFSTEKGTIIGLVSMTILEDKDCEECYDPEDFHKPILDRMGVIFGDENRLDVSSKQGKELVEKYNVTQVPTVFLKGDPEVYPLLVRSWNDVGTIEEDETWVFRRVDLAKKIYKNLITGEIVQG